MMIEEDSAHVYTPPDASLKEQYVKVEGSCVSGIAAYLCNHLPDFVMSLDSRPK